jgi:cyclophilin family peptidyl-prolyl cis-trans isomerase
MRFPLLAALLFLGRQVGAQETPAAPPDAKPVTPEPAMNAVSVTIVTSMGKMTAELDAAKAPVTVSNFLAYVDAKFYDGTIFHRVMPRFMIQGGGFTAEMMQKETRPPIRNEAGNGLKNKRGTLAMARTGVIDSATGQFFINLVDNVALDHAGNDVQTFGYAVFGHLTSGHDVLDAIARVPTGSFGPHQNVPRTPVVIASIRRTAAEGAAVPAAAPADAPAAKP